MYFFCCLPDRGENDNKLCNPHDDDDNVHSHALSRVILPNPFCFSPGNNTCMLAPPAAPKPNIVVSFPTRRLHEKRNTTYYFHERIKGPVACALFFRHLFKLVYFLRI
jgi:hypothetical protein